MTKGFVILSLVLGLASVSFGQDAQPVERPDFKPFFDKAGVDGTLFVHDLTHHSSLVYNRKRAEMGFLPASTFKILNSLIGLETGVVRDADQQVFKWDGVKREIAAWNHDHTLRSAIKYSVVPVYQEIARQIGAVRMAHYLQAVGYGNYDIGGTTVDEFWLQGNLRISAEEQVRFLTRLHEGDLPFSKRSMDIVKDITIIEKTDAYTWHSKTGWGKNVQPQVGWLVGWVDRGGDTFIYAMNIEVQKESQLPARMDITRAVLHLLGIV